MTPDKTPKFRRILRPFPGEIQEWWRQAVTRRGLRNYLCVILKSVTQNDVNEANFRDLKFVNVY